MKTNIFLTLTTAVLLSSNPFTPAVFGGDATTELKALVGKIRDALADGKNEQN